MENSLDGIANGDKEWVPVMKAFWEPFSRALLNATDSAETIKLSVETLDEMCPLCGGQLVIRTGRYGKFVACSKFPECKYTRQYGETIDKLCPKCGGAIVVKKSRKGKTFYGCSNYPTCDFAAWKKEDIK
jgi:DNA topoisomerase-1